MKCAAVLAPLVSGVLPIAHRTRTPPPPPAPAASTSRPNFTGTWVLNPDLSDEPIHSAFNMLRERPGGQGRQASGRLRRPRRIRRTRRLRWGRNSAPSDAEDTPEQRAMATELTTQVKVSPSALTISHKIRVTIPDDREYTHVVQTNGAADKHQLMSGTVTITTRWEGPAASDGVRPRQPTPSRLHVHIRYRRPASSRPHPAGQRPRTALAGVETCHDFVPAVKRPGSER